MNAIRLYWAKYVESLFLYTCEDFYMGRLALLRKSLVFTWKRANMRRSIVNRLPCMIELKKKCWPFISTCFFYLFSTLFFHGSVFFLIYVCFYDLINWKSSSLPICFNPRHISQTRPSISHHSKVNNKRKMFPSNSWLNAI